MITYSVKVIDLLYRTMAKTPTREKSKEEVDKVVG